LAVIQSGLFLLIGPMLAFVGLAPAIDLDVSIMDAVSIILFLTLLAFTLTALGYVIAWPLDSTQGFHAIMSVFLMPMWLLSGAFFPAEDSGWLSWVITMNPLTYGVAGLRQLMYPKIDFSASNGLPGLGLCILITVLFCVVYVGLAVFLTHRRTSPDAR
jgi:ABC-type polysaccharide/polyol phosphate export permease